MTRKKRRERVKKFRENIPIPSQRRRPDAIELDQELSHDFNSRSKHGAGEWAAGLFCPLFFPAAITHCRRKKRVDRVVNRLEAKFGSTRVVQRDQVRPHLTEPVSMLGVVANIRSLDFVMDLEMVAPETFVARNLESFVDLRRLFTNMRVRTKEQFSGYHRIETSTASAAGNK